MPALNFTVFIDKILSGEKKQTIRPLRKRPIRSGDKLYLYTSMRHKGCKKLGEAACGEVIPVTLISYYSPWTPLTIGGIKSDEWNKVLELAEDDGFDSYTDFANFFINTYKMKEGDCLKFEIIKWRDFKADSLGISR